jgi:hypothetical protein
MLSGHTLDVIRTRKSFSLISHDSIVLESGRTLPDTPSFSQYIAAPRKSIRTGVDDLLGFD